MNNKVISFSPNVEYSGFVTLTVVSNDGKIRSIQRCNHGTDFLFNFLSRCLCGYNVSSTAPGYMSIVDKDHEDVIISSKRELSDRQTVNKTDLGWCSIFRCAFPRNSVNTSGVPSVCLIKLISADGTSDMAKVEMNGDVLSNLLPGTTLYVEWTMQISNKETQTSTTPQS